MFSNDLNRRLNEYALNKQAFVGPLIRAGAKSVPHLTKAFTSAKKVLPKRAPKPVNPYAPKQTRAQKFVRPEVTPKPAKVEANQIRLSKRPVSDNRLKAKATKALNYTANVPKGEAFRQRPIRNSLRLMSFDGVPFMRKINWPSFAFAAGNAGYTGYRTNQNINSMLDVAGDDLSNRAGLNSDQRTQLRDNLRGAKRGLTLAQIKQLTRVGSLSEAQKAENAAVRSAVREQLARQLYSGKEKTLPEKVLSFRTPWTAAYNHVAKPVFKYMVGPPQKSDDALMKDMATQLQPLSVPVSTEDQSVLQRQIKSTYDMMTPEQRQNLLLSGVRN